MAQSSPKRPIPLVVWVILAVAGIAALGFWDAQREAAAALDEFAQEQAHAAKGAASALAAHLALERDARSDHGVAAVLSSMRPFEQPGSLIVIVRRPEPAGLVDGNGTNVTAPELDAAFTRGESSVLLSRWEATSLGLPGRSAAAGLSSFDAGPLGTWGVAVVASAQREREHDVRAEWRLVLGVLVASGLVLAFGSIAMRKQRKELDLARELAISALEQQRDERLVRADKLATMGALATGIAHEVSTPLGVIMGHAEQLAAKLEGDERGKKAVQVISDQAERISRIIRGVLSLARGDAPSLEHVSPAEVARQSIDLVEHRFAKAGVRLKSAIDDNVRMIACDPRLFEQVIVNLLLNACDASQAGAMVELAVSCDAKRVEFRVTDDGEGITPEAAARATEPFFTTKPEGKGTGLGLAIANEIVKHHHGELTLEPRPRGTRACVRIPVASEP